MTRRRRKGWSAGTFYWIAAVVCALFALDLVMKHPWVLGVVALGITLLIAGFIARNVSRRRKERERLERIRESGIDEIDYMDGHAFENRMQLALHDLGWSVENVGARGGDYGTDLVLKDVTGHTVAVQLKRSAGSVGNAAVQQAGAGRSYYGADEAWVVTNSYFTAAARAQAASSRVRLFARPDLIEILNAARGELRSVQLRVNMAWQPHSRSV